MPRCLRFSQKVCCVFCYFCHDFLLSLHSTSIRRPTIVSHES